MKKYAILTRSNLDKTSFLCECGNPVVSAYYDSEGYLHTSGVEICNLCGLNIDEDTIDEKSIITEK